jgi:hypothetical protein
MANTDAAFGLKAIGKVGQNRDNQGLSEYSIAASTAVIYNSDPVALDANGELVRGTAGATNYLLGSLNGVYYTDASSSKPTWANHLAASNTATDIVGFVSDDPYERFEIQSAGTVAQTNIGNCAAVVLGAGVAPNWVSKAEINGTMANTASQLKILGLAKDEGNEFGANANVVVIISQHQLKQEAGI